MHAHARKNAKPFESQLLPEDAEPLPKPWLEVPDPRVRTSWWITVFLALVGVGLSALLVFNGIRTLPRIGNVCLVLDEEFDGPSLDTSIWTREVNMDGFGNGEFEMTTDSDTNSFVKDGKLFIVPTLTSDVIGRPAILDGYTYNITSCTAANTKHNVTSCSAVSNSTAGAVINPVMSARLHTRNSKSIRYGRVEVKAKLPQGDWMWPAIWMLPVDETYGPWPSSGEIDIMESRGNDPNYRGRGRNYAQATLNWGPTPDLNLAWKTNGFWYERRTSFADAFHVYTLEWDEDFIWMYIDTRLHKMLDRRIKKSFWDTGHFPTQVFNGSSVTLLENPWQSGAKSAPFDQPFYLILNVAVGGTNGWFPDTFGNKPWENRATTAMRDFAIAQDTWAATWPAPEERAMQVEYVKMYQKC
ncbi:concanavalin A-like lectin/glucanase [Exidia glandulosa HHB12029]|uniref:Concanavalin A-like lectin/glucanase n=1 Tax=Exidia glandulosa HHB12029 TaxID=1314781 RepID=A0A165IW06_EXIGL|nr:concanavalin A-like lectin/glucanase [Exidia glandulosa HHB12029]